MKCRRIPIEAEVCKYELDKGLEDGFALWAEILTQSWINTSTLVKVQRENGTIVCPYVMHRRGRTFISDGDYIITDSDGTKHVCGPDKIFQRYEIVEE